jgi:hypothetical protein
MPKMVSLSQWKATVLIFLYLFNIFPIMIWRSNFPHYNIFKMERNVFDKDIFIECNIALHSYIQIGSNSIMLYADFNPKNSFCCFDQFLQFLTYLEESISLPEKVWELEEVTVGSWSYLVEHQPQKITPPHSMGSRRL